MEKRVELELRGRKPSEVTVLNLDNCHATSISGLTEEFSSLEHLSMLNVGLTSLKGLPALNSLTRLDLCDNRISGGLENLLCCANIERISLSGNKIKDIEQLWPLKKLKSLEVLDLFDNDISKGENYRADVFKVLPQLKFLDGYDVNNTELISENDEYGDEDIFDEEDEQDEQEQEDEDEIEDEGEDEESEVGLDYLESSKAVEDEDETEDFHPHEDGEDESHTPKAAEKNPRRGLKRKHVDEEDPDL